MTFMNSIEKFIIKEKFSYSLLLVISLWGMKKLRKTNIFFYTSLVLISISICSLLKLSGPCKNKCKCISCKILNCLSHFINYFSTSMLTMDILCMGCYGSVTYIAFAYAAILFTYAMRRKNLKNKQQTHDFLNYSTCVFLCVISFIENNMYGIAAGIASFFISYISRRSRTKRRQSNASIQERKSYLQMIFIYFAVYAVMLMAQRRFRCKESFYKVMNKVHSCTSKALEPFSCLVNCICGNTLYKAKNYFFAKLRKIWDEEEDLYDEGPDCDEDDDEYEC